MARYCTTIDSTLAPAAALALLADFTSAKVWDPSVVDARRIDHGAVRVGSRFHIVTSFLGAKIKLDYEVIELTERRVVLQADTGRLVGTDSIDVQAAPGGSKLTYDAGLRIVGPARVLDPVLNLLFQRLGNNARNGLRLALNPNS